MVSNVFSQSILMQADLGMDTEQTEELTEQCGEGVCSLRYGERREAWRTLVSQAG